MAPNNAYQAYNNSKIMTASPAELTLMLYEGAIKFCNIAIMGVEEKNVEKAHTNIMKVEHIIEEFQATLDHKYAIAEDFDNVYLFDYRLARVVNQEPKQFLDIEDKDTQQTVIQKFEDKINVILESKYYKENKDRLSQNLIIPQKTLELIKSVAGIY